MTNREFAILSEAAVRRMRDSVGSECPFVLHVGEWLTHLNFFSDAQIYRILAFLLSPIEACSYDSKLRENTIFDVADSRWITVTGRPHAFDADTFDIVDTAAAMSAVTHVVCNVSALYQRMQIRQGKRDDATASASGEKR